MADNDFTPRRSRRLDWLVGVGVTLAAFGLYLSTLAPTVLEADAGEFQFTPWLPGIAHPTGYPLYLLVGWVWTHLLPAGEVAWRMNLLSAVFAALAVGLTYAATRQLAELTLPAASRLSRIVAAVLAAAAFAVSHTFWSQAVMAEVYALHAMFTALILGLALRLRYGDNGPSHGVGKLLAFTYGLSLTHHSTTVLLFPALALFGWLRRPHSTDPNLRSRHPFGFAQDRPHLRLRSLLPAAMLFTAPLLLYLYLPLIAPATPYATLRLSRTQVLTLYDQSWQGFLDHITGSVFAAGLQPAAVGTERILLVWQLLQQQVGRLGTFLAVAGLATLWRLRQFDLLILTGVTFLTMIAFNLVYFIGDVFVLFIPAWLIVCMWAGLGSLGLVRWIRLSFFGGRGGRYIWLRTMLIGAVFGFFFLMVVVSTTRNIAEVNQKNNTHIRQRWQEILAEPIPANAILLSNDRNEIMPMWYYQYVEGRRPDLLGIFPWIIPHPDYANVGRVLEQALASGRPVYLIKPMAGLSLKADLTPAGTLFQATPNPMSPTYRRDLILPEIIIPQPGGNVTETIKLSGYDLSSTKTVTDTEISVTLYWQAIQELSIDYTSYIHVLNSQGERVAQNDQRPGGDFYPSSAWQAGETLRDRHILTMPADLAPDIYELRAGMYYQPQPGLIAGMGQGATIAQLTLEDLVAGIAPE